MGRKSCFYQPPFYVARPGAEVHAYPEQWATVGFEGLRVVLFVNLPQRFFGSAFELELHDVDVERGPHVPRRCDIPLGYRIPPA